MKYIFLAFCSLIMTLSCQATDPHQELQTDTSRKMRTYSIDLAPNSQGDYLFFEIFSDKQKNKAKIMMPQMEKSGNVWTRVYPFPDSTIGYDMLVEEESSSPAKLIFIKLSKEDSQNPYSYKLFDFCTTIVLDTQHFTPLASSQDVEIKKIDDHYVLSDEHTRILLSKVQNPLL